MKRINDDIKRGALSRAYLLHGSEPYLLREYAARLTDAAVPPHVRAMNAAVLTGNDATARMITEALETPPFLHERRLVTVKDADMFAPAKRAEADALADYVADIPDDATLLLIEPAPDKRTKLYKQIANIGYAAQLDTPKEPELIKWLARQCAAYGKELSKGAAAYLVRVGSSMDLLAAECAKLAAYVGDAPEVTAEDIKAVCSMPLESRVFAMLDAIGEQRAADAVSLYADMIALRESPLMILTMIARQFRNILLCAGLKQLANNEIAERTGQKPFAVTTCLRQSRNFTEGALKNALRDCLETDVAIKTGRVNDRLGVELLIIRRAAQIGGRA